MLVAQRPVLLEDQLDPTRSRFVLEPLEPGFGHTLAAPLRRALLSSIPGAAATSLRVAGALHEFTTLPGVVEDVTDLVLNVKGLTLASTLDDPATLRLRVEGPAEVTAADLVVPAGVEVSDPSHHLATVSAGGVLDLELVVERGRGYVSASSSAAPIGTIALDAVYSPVLRVSYSVEATRVGQRTDFDRLVLDVETRSSTSPREALASAGSTLVELLSLVSALDPSAEGLELGPLAGVPFPADPSPEGVGALLAG